MEDEQDQLASIGMLRAFWGLVLLTVLVFGLGLSFLGKLSYMELPAKLVLPDYLALGGWGLLLLGLFLFQTRVRRLAQWERKAGAYLLVWSLFMLTALMGFSTTFIKADGNAFFYVVNAVLALFFTLLTFPRR
jgi:hypothetical protein